MSPRFGVLQWFGLQAFRGACVLLPRWLREDAGADIVDAFREKQQAAAQSGLLPLLILWARESAGLVHTAFRARHPDPWTRRTIDLATRGNESTLNPTRLTMDQLWTDLRFTLRTFSRRPGSSLLAVAVLSLGIGASTAMFSVVESVLLRRLPYPDAEALHAVYPAWPNLKGHPTLGFLADRGTWSWPEFFTVYESQTSFEQLAAYQSIEMTLRGGERPERIRVVESTHELFPMLGVTPHLGRLFDAGDGAGDGAGVVLLGAGFWRDRFGADPEILGRTLDLSDSPYEVVGVLPDAFELEGASAGVWKVKSGSPTDGGMGNHGGTRAIGRLLPSVPVERAREEVARILREQLPPDHGQHDASVFALQDEQIRTVRPVLFGLMMAAGLLLVVACGNVAVLLLGMGLDRERELAVRSAVGATRSRLAQQLLSESSLLAIAGAVGGVGVAAAATRALVYLAPPGVPNLEHAALNPLVLGFTIVLTMVCGIGVGSLPALSLSKVNLASSVGAARRFMGERARLQSAVVVGELALATLLIVFEHPAPADRVRLEFGRARIRPRVTRSRLDRTVDARDHGERRGR